MRTMTVQRIRRVVTGVAAEGKAVVASDGSPPVVVQLDSSPGNEFFMIWGTDDVPRVPTDGTDPTLSMESFSPEPTGTRFLINRFPPGAGTKAVKGTVGTADEFADKMPGLSESLESE